jgi:hypothetical protein
MCPSKEVQRSPTESHCSSRPARNIGTNKTNKLVTPEVRRRQRENTLAMPVTFRVGAAFSLSECAITIVASMSTGISDPSWPGAR